MLSPSVTIIFFAAARIAGAQYASTTTFTFGGNALPTGLASYVSFVPGGENTKYEGYEFQPELSYVEEGYLNLLVPGGQQNEAVIWSAEVQTDFTVSAAKVDTYAILTDTAGVVNGKSHAREISHSLQNLVADNSFPGMFSYDSDTSISGGVQESDIEWLSDMHSRTLLDQGLARALLYTNQNTTVVGGQSTTGPGVVPADATNKVHKYSIDWSNGQTSFFLDDVAQYQFTTNVPTTTKASWVWNCWSNGDPYFSVGPPTTDAVFKIQKIVMAYNPGTA